MSSGAVDPWGRVVFGADDLLELLYQEVPLHALAIEGDARIDGYNRWCAAFNKPGHRIAPVAAPAWTPDEEHRCRADTWLADGLPPEADLRPMLLARCADEAERARVALEMEMFEARGMVPVLRAVLALIEHFRAHGIVWGVGRGSSCASFCLYLLGVHCVHSLRHGLDIGEFLKPVTSGT